MKCTRHMLNTGQTVPLIACEQLPAPAEVSSVVVELRQCDEQEKVRVTAFTQGGCRCHFGPGGSPCCRLFQVEEYEAMRCWCAELSKEQKDCVLKGQIIAMTNTSQLTVHTTSHRHKSEERNRERTSYSHRGLTVCRTTFLFLHDTSLKVFKALRRSCRDQGLLPRVHGNTKRLPKHTLTYEDVKHVVSFIVNYAEDHGILLPGRIPGYKRTDLQLLPCSTTKRSVHRLYTEAADEQAEIHTVHYTTFCTNWRKLLSHILPTCPMTDLCAVCHENAALIIKSSNLTEKEKSQVRTIHVLFSYNLTNIPVYTPIRVLKFHTIQTLKNYEQHLNQATVEQSVYRTSWQRSCSVLKDHLASLPPATASEPQPPSLSFMHYSFDFAQQVHYPSDPWQPGPVYFLTPRKCALFGVCCEAAPHQVWTKQSEGDYMHTLYISHCRSTTLLMRRLQLERGLIQC